MKNNTKEFVLKKDQIDLEKDNFRTSMLIMAFLACPLILVGLIAFCVRLKNLGKLKDLSNTTNLGKNLETKQKKLGQWLGNATNRKKRNGFTRLNQNSDNEEAEQLTNQNGSNESDSESDEIGIQLPTISKA